jgi:hypothetical protein
MSINNAGGGTMLFQAPTLNVIRMCVAILLLPAIGTQGVISVLSLLCLSLLEQSTPAAAAAAAVVESSSSSLSSFPVAIRHLFFSPRGIIVGLIAIDHIVDRLDAFATRPDMWLPREWRFTRLRLCRRNGDTCRVTRALFVYLVSQTQRFIQLVVLYVVAAHGFAQLLSWLGYGTSVLEFCVLSQALIRETHTASLLACWLLSAGTKLLRRAMPRMPLPMMPRGREGD